MSLRKVKVLNITKSWGSTTKYEGISTVIMNLYKHMNSNLIQFDVANINSNKSVFEEELIQYGGCVYQMVEKGQRKPRWKICIDIIKLIKRENYDAVYVHVSMGYDAWWIIPIAFFTSVPMRIVHAHNAGLNGSTFDKLRILVNKLIKPFIGLAATDLFACSQKAAAWCFQMRTFCKKGHIVKNAIDCNKYVFSEETRNKIRKEEGWEDYTVIGHVGRISYQKNQEFLIHLAKRLNSTLNIKLVLIGGGSTEEIKKLNQCIKNNSLENIVVYKNVQQKVNEYLQAMDCFVFPSRYEGLGITAIEAQAAGLPTICSDAIPEEAHVTNLFYTISLDEPIEKWCDLIVDTLKCNIRKDTSDKLHECGYDIYEVAQSLQEYLLIGGLKYEKNRNSNFS